MSKALDQTMSCDQTLSTSERRVFHGKRLTAVTVTPGYTLYNEEKREAAFAHLMNLAFVALGRSNCEPVSSAKGRTSLSCPDGAVIEVGDGPTHRYGPDGSRGSWTRNAVITRKK